MVTFQYELTFVGTGVLDDPLQREVNFDLLISYIPRKAQSDIVAYATVILLTLFAVVLYSPVKSTREAHNTRRKSNITAKQYHSPLGEYNCGATPPPNPQFSVKKSPRAFTLGDFICFKLFLVLVEVNYYLTVVFRTD